MKMYRDGNTQGLQRMLLFVVFVEVFAKFQFHQDLEVTKWN